MHAFRMIIIIKLLCFVMIFSLIMMLLNAAVVNSSASYTKRSMDDFYNQEQIDLVIIGSSVVYRSCNPLIFDEKLGINTFNLGSSSQSLQDTYYLLKEVFQFFKPHYVVTNISPYRLTNEETEDAVSSHLIFDYMRWSFNKADYLFRAFSIDNYQSALFPSYRGRKNFSVANVLPNLKSNISYAKNTRRERILEELGSADTENIYFAKGFVRSSRAFVVGQVSKEDSVFFLGEESVSPYMYSYLEKIKNLCDEHSAELILFTPPQHAVGVLYVNSYANFESYANRFANRNGLTYWDFNYTRPEHLEFEDDMFYDYHHMNNNLSGKFSELFAEMLLEYMADKQLDKEQYFYHSYNEFLTAQKRVSAVWIDEITQQEVVAKAYSGNNKVEYRFSFAQNSDVPEFCVFSPYSDNAKVDLPNLSSGNYLIRVEARLIGSENEYDQVSETELIVP